MSFLVYNAVGGEDTYGPVLVREDDMTMYVNVSGLRIPVVQYGPDLIPCFPGIVIGLITGASEIPDEQYRAFTVALRRVSEHVSFDSRLILGIFDRKNKDDIAQGLLPRYATEADARAAEQRDRENCAASGPFASVLDLWDSFGGTVSMPSATTFHGKGLPPNYPVAQFRSMIGDALAGAPETGAILTPEVAEATHPTPTSRPRVRPNKPKRGKGKPRRRRR
ncbi:hypothetical protein KIPB_013564 [Kipferlia bialata]|uniref:Uncharacterized protein n=1 Tax=Kipferlia bialata TaxID=797122 RepID=A0A391NS90_9EUKA|nr:hypothetical protein KIPB_013564 [Kipferlia bialata]|eukprot:g13564.t1